MLLLTQLVKQKAKWAAAEGDQNASITTQLVKQEAKRAAIEDGDHNASITTHIEKKKKKKKKKHQKNRKQWRNHKATESKNNTRTTALEQTGPRRYFYCCIFINCSVVFHLRMLSFNTYVSLRYIQWSLGNKVATFFGKGLPTPLAIFSFSCSSLIVFVCLSLWCCKLDLGLIVLVPGFIYLLYISFKHP